MRAPLLVMIAAIGLWGCSVYDRNEECDPETCDGQDTDCDGFVDETRHECPDGRMVQWCKCDADNSFTCSQDPERLCRDSHCDDGTEPTCYMEPPVCEEDEILAHRDNCFLCVDPDTCQPTGRDTHCDDGTEPMCDMQPPQCAEYEILAHQNSCYRCVNPDSCIPWGTPECEFDYGCEVIEHCDPCGSSSCPGCEDCVPACRPHGCETEDMALCMMMRPDCEHNQVAVVQDGCWVCVNLRTCQPETCQAGEERLHTCEDGSEVPWCVCNRQGEWDCITSPESQCRDTSCDDGTPIQCDGPVPECDQFEILAYQNYCYECVNPATCLPWGQPGCEEDQFCAPDEFCDPCGTSSCPMCDDCLPACQPHGCPSEEDLTCWCARPYCGDGAVSVIYDGCWICVYWDSCEPTGEEC